jgi:hypothetical protein
MWMPSTFGSFFFIFSFYQEVFKPYFHKFIYGKTTKYGMDFKKWLNEVTADPSYNPLARKLYKNQGSKPHLSGSRVFYVDRGKIIDGYPSGGTSWHPYYELNPNARSIQLHNVDPSGKEFRQVVKYLKKFIPKIDDFEVSLMNLSHPENATRGKYYHNVSYWLGQKDTSVNPQQKLPEFLYHGTSTELWYSGIKSKGLMPRNTNPSGATGSYGASGALSHGDKVYLSVHPDLSTRGAAKQASSAHGGQPLIVKIRTDGLDLNKITGDEDMDKEYQSTVKQAKEMGQRVPSFASVSQQRMGAVAYAGRIPASLIQPFLMGKRQINGIVDKWEPFQDIGQDEHALTKKLKQGGWFSSYDSPYFYALVDEGILKPTEKDRLHYEVADPSSITDELVRALIKKSPWVVDANTISKELNDYGKNIKNLHYYPTKVEEPKLQKIIDMLVDSHIYLIQKNTPPYRDYLSYYSWDATPKAIKLAKDLHKNKMSYSDMLKGMAEIEKKYKPE